MSRTMTWYQKLVDNVWSNAALISWTTAWFTLGVFSHDWIFQLYHSLFN